MWCGCAPGGKGGASKGGAPKGGAPKGGARRVDRPKFRSFFPSPATIFFLSSGAAGVSRQPESPNVHISGPRPSNPTKIPRKDPQEREERMKIVAGEGKKRAKFWAVRRRGGPARSVRCGWSGGWAKKGVAPKGGAPNGWDEIVFGMKVVLVCVFLSGCVMVVGCWLLVVGCWLLVLSWDESGFG